MGQNTPVLVVERRRVLSGAAKCTNGKRNVAAFVARKNYDQFNFLSDYRFLESLDRDNEYREKNLYDIRNSSRGRQRTQSKLVIAARSLCIDYRPSSSSLLTRAKLNRTQLICENPPTLSWTVEFCLLYPNTCASQGEEKPWSDSVLKPLHILVHDCLCASLLSEIWHAKISNLTSSEQEALSCPGLSGVRSADDVDPSVTSWLLSLGDLPPYFYVQCVDKQSRTYPKHEIFPDSTTLLDVLKWDKFVVHEFPTIWVSKKELSLS
ncbi:unnamed protein product [Mesocestoides corti]|uniref:Uncharacterized protein n=1 Tax=Mesocestoides corti TaxID=53468 RepID=A0A0R3UKY5_MESCO|nr:unnamed protein product [Mesocestoides corti]